MTECLDIYQDTLIRRVSDIETLVSIYMYRLNIYVRDSIYIKKPSYVESLYQTLSYVECLIETSSSLSVPTYISKHSHQ